MLWTRKIRPEPEVPLNEASCEDLARRKREIDDELARRGPQELERLKKQLLLLAHAYGHKVQDLFPAVEAERPSSQKVRKKRTITVKYRNPDNPAETWTGIGKPKKWLQRKLDEGRGLEEFALPLDGP